MGAFVGHHGDLSLRFGSVCPIESLSHVCIHKYIHIYKYIYIYYWVFVFFLLKGNPLK